MTLRYSIVVVKEGRDYWAYAPALPGVYGRAKSRTGAKKDFTEALKLYAEDCRAGGEPLPRPIATVVSVDQVSIPA